MTAPTPPPRPRRAVVWLIAAAALVAVTAGVAWRLAAPPADPGRPATDPPLDPPPSGGGPPWLRDVTAGSGLHFTHRNGEEAGLYTILETLGSGVALIDYDGDGLLDVFAAGGGGFAGTGRTELTGDPCRLFKNLGGWKFRDVTAEAGLDRVSWWYTHGAAVADYDRDGWPDLLVTGYGRLALFRNVSDGKGGRRFADVTAEVGLKDDQWSTSAAWADLDGDGYPDLYVCRYLHWSLTDNPACPGQRPGVKRDVCPPARFKPQIHAVFRNEKGKRFHDESARVGFTAAGYGLGVVAVDVNDDGKPDVYVGNDTSNNFLFLNRSAGGRMALEEKGMDAGVAVNELGTYDGSMGVDAGDYDGSGRASLWVANYQGDLHALYANGGGERFEHRSRAAGIGALGQQWVGFGTAFVDLDNDGWADLVIINGHVVRQPNLGSTYKQRPHLLRNVEYKGRRFFVDASVRGGPYCQTPHLGRGLGVGDLDNDGWPDLVVSNTNEPGALLRNVAAAGMEGPSRWLGIQLRGRENRDIVGSTVVVELEGGRRLTRFPKGGGSYLSAGDPRLIFGLGAAGKVERVTVKWSWGKTEHWGKDRFEVGRYYDLHEGNPAPKPAKR